MQLPLLPLAAADWAQLIIGLIVVGGYILKLVTQAGKGASETTAQPVPPPPPRKPVPGNLQKEIDIFLQDVNPRKATTERTTPSDSRVLQRDSQRTTAQKGNEGKRRSQNQGKQGTRSGDMPRSARATPGSEIANRKQPGRENLGTEVSQRVAAHLDSNSLSQRVQQDLQNRVQESVTQHLGEASDRLKGTPVTPPAAAVINPTAQQVLEILKRPGQIRQAIMVNEILSRPLSRRRREAY